MRYVTPVIFFLVIGLAKDCFPAAMAYARERDIPHEVTSAINPVEDGTVTRVIFIEGRVVYGWSAHGGWDGEVREQPLSEAWASPEPARWKAVVNLGHNSLLAKNDGIFNMGPRLIALVGDKKYVINLNTCQDFPAKSEPGSAVTGNVVVYDAAKRSFENLTKLDGRLGRYAEALRWFPVEGVLLIEDSTVGESDFPMPVDGTGKPKCVRLRDGAWVPIAEYPEIERWYRRHQALWVQRRPREVEGGADAQTLWTVHHPDGKTKSTLRSRLSDIHQAVYRFLLPEGRFCVSNEKLGTYLLGDSGGGGVARKISDHVAIDYDESSGLLILRSAEADRLGQYRYWTMAPPLVPVASGAARNDALSWGAPPHPALAVESAPSRLHLEEITDSVGPVNDGFTSRVIFRDGEMIYGITGTKQSTHLGRVWRGAHRDLGPQPLLDPTMSGVLESQASACNGSRNCLASSLRARACHEFQR